MILEYIAIIALLIVSVYILYRGIRKLIAFLQDRMHFLPESEKEAMTENSDIRERLEGISGRSVSGDQKRFSFLFPDAAQKIRHMYQKKINSCGLAKMSIPFYTARDAQKALGITGMAEIYEKARYSGIPCTEEDVRQMKNKLR